MVHRRYVIDDVDVVLGVYSFCTGLLRSSVWMLLYVLVFWFLLYCSRFSYGFASILFDVCMVLLLVIVLIVFLLFEFFMCVSCRFYNIVLPYLFREVIILRFRL